MSVLKRVRGDNYPVEATLKVNGTAVPIPDGATALFSYIKKGETVPKTITGIISNPALAEVKFFPTETDFQEAGMFKFDIQKVVGGIRTTHLIGQLVIDDDITKN